MAVSAQGAWVVDETGKRYLDASGGCAVANIGHGIQEVAKALAQQAATLAYVNGTQFTNPAAEALAEALTPHLAPSLIDPRCYFMCTGSEAVEAALKFVRQIWVERGKPHKTHFISRNPSYHGNTLAGLSLSAREHYRVPFAPLLHDWHKIPAPRGEGQDLAAAQALEHLILELGAENVAGFIAEPIGGSSVGAVIPDEGYWETIQAICHRYQILFIADEVMCGMGRTGRWLASEHFDLQPDVVVLGKGINGGYAPLSALIARGALVDELAQGSGNFLHAGTYTHTPVMCAVGLATVQYLEQHQLVARSESFGREFHTQLRQALKSCASVSRINGVGLFAGIEFLRDPSRKTPFPRDLGFIEQLTQAAFNRGLIVWPNVGHINGHDGDLLILAPPFTLTQEELDWLMVRLVDSIQETEQVFISHAQ